ncbi:MAG: hypothetical protein KDK78_04100 [Chlamydiia bacterium]|nr:hypothetical protein [Chlamydiia bacterium]
MSETIKLIEGPKAALTECNNSKEALSKSVLGKVWSSIKGAGAAVVGAFKAAGHALAALASKVGSAVAAPFNSMKNMYNVAKDPKAAAQMITRNFKHMPEASAPARRDQDGEAVVEVPVAPTVDPKRELERRVLRNIVYGPENQDILSRLTRESLKAPAMAPQLLLEYPKQEESKKEAPESAPAQAAQPSLLHRIGSGIGSMPSASMDAASKLAGAIAAGVSDGVNALPSYQATKRTVMAGTALVTVMTAAAFATNIVATAVLG